jgi:heat shock protein HtpX
MERRALGRSASLTIRMAAVMLLVVCANVGIVVGVVALYYARPDWLLYITIPTVAIGGSAIAYYRSGDGFFLRSAGLEVHPAPPELIHHLERLAALADLAAPRLLVVESRDPNAFTVGARRGRELIVVTTALVKRLDRDELDAVLAHELSHIANRDVAVMTVASVPRTIGALLVRGRGDDVAFFLWYLIWPLGLPVMLFGWLLTLALSRTREFAADRGSAIITGQPELLMSALAKLAGKHASPGGDLRTVEAFCIVPTSLRRLGLFMDHPPLAKRLAALAEITRELGRPEPPRFHLG